MAADLVSMEPELAELLNQTAIIEPKTGRDKYNKLTYGTAVSKRCRATNKQVLVNLPDGTTKVSRCYLIFDGDVVLDREDLLTLPDGTKPPILSVTKFADDDGTDHHLEVYTA